MKKEFLICFLFFVFLTCANWVSAENFYPVSSANHTGSTDGINFTRTSKLYSISTLAELGYARFDISAIPSSATINSIVLHLYIADDNYAYFDITQLDNDPTTSSAADVYADIQSSPSYYSYEADFPNPGWFSEDLGSDAVTKLQEQVSNGSGWFGIGLYEDDGFGTYYIEADGWNDTNPPYIDIDYTYIPGAIGAPSNPAPTNHEINIALDGNLTWTWGANTETYDLWFGETGNMIQVVTGAAAGAEGTQDSYTYSGLTNSTNYEWQLILHNSNPTDLDGPIWNFTTRSQTVTTFPYTESFETWIPTGWSLTSATNNHWTQNNGTDYGPGTAYAGTYAAMYDNYDISNGNSGSMITPPLDLTSLTTPMIEFYWWNNDGASTPASITIATSTDGISYSDIETIDAFGSGETTWVKYDHVITTDVQFVQITATSDYGMKNTYIDEFVIKEAPTAPIFTVDPTSKDYGTLFLGDSQSQTFTITNTGGGTLTISSIGLTGTDSNQFSLTDGNSYPHDLGAGEDIIVDVAFTPTSEGTKSANLTIIDNLARSEKNISLTGIGFDGTQTLTFMEDWEAVTPPALPAYWDVDIPVNGILEITTTNNHTSGGSKSLHASATNSSGATTSITGYFESYSAGNDVFLDFWYNLQGVDDLYTDYMDIWVDIYDNQWHEGIFHDFVDYNGGTGWTLGSVDLSTYDLSSGYRIRFRMYSSNTASYHSIYLDDITLYENINPPNCTNPISPMDSETGFDILSDIQWAPATGSPEGYKIYLGTDNPPTNMENGTDVGNATLFTPGSGAPIASDLFISEYIEGSSFNKAVEIFNGTGADVDLMPYTVKLATNGSTWGTTYDLLGTLVAGDVFVIAHPSASDQTLLDNTDVSNSVCNFNGDDAFGLFKSDVLIDVIGEYQVDPGSGWDVAGETNGTQDNTIVRKSSILSPNTDWAVSAGTNATDSEWEVYAQDNFDNIGFHSLNGGSGTLEYATTYYWQIAPYNTNGTNTSCSVWSFTTMDDPTITTFPWTENFDTATLPDGWTSTPSGDGDQWLYDTSAGYGANQDYPDGTGSFAWIDDSQGQIADPAILTTPPIDATLLTNPTLTFYYWIGTGSTSSTLHIDVYNGLIWHEGVSTVTSNGQWDVAEVDLLPYQSTETRVRFRGIEDNSGYQSDISLDYITVFDNSFPPNCSSPLMPADTATDITLDGNLKWGNVSGAQGYKIFFGSDTPPTDIENGLDIGNVTQYAFGTTTADLFISEYIEGSSNNKVIEIYNGTGQDIDLTPYSIKRSNNGAADWDDVLSLTGTLVAGDVYIIANSSAVQSILDVADITHSITWYNGDDAIGLFKDDVMIDAIGILGQDPGDGWDVAGVSMGTQNHTIIRKANVFSGNTDWVTSAGTNANDSQWIVYAEDNFDHLNSHILAGTSMDLLYVTDYYWQIVPYNEFGDAVGCATWQFTTMPDPTINTFPWIENFTNGVPPTYWRTGGSKAWSVYDNNGNTCSEASLWGWPDGNDAYMITVPLNLSTITDPYTFNFKWSSYFNSSYLNDQLIVSVTKDGGDTWYELFNKVGTELNSNDGATNTAPGTFTEETITLPPEFDGQTVQFKFHAISDYGPDVFIDDIAILPFGELEGIVTEAGTGNPLEGVNVTVDGNTTTTDGTGYYYFSLQPGTYDISTDLQYYSNTVTNGVIVTSSATTQQDIIMEPTNLSVNPTSLSVTIDPMQTTDQTFTITNNGTGDLPYTINVYETTVAARSKNINASPSKSSTNSKVKEVVSSVSKKLTYLSGSKKIKEGASRVYNWYSYATSDQFTALSYDLPERATLFQGLDFGLTYPLSINQLSHTFYENPSNPWSDATFHFKVYASDGNILLYESADLEATTGADFIYELPEPLRVNGDFYVAVVPVDATGAPQSVITNQVSGHSYTGTAGNWTLQNTDFITGVYVDVTDMWLILSSYQGVIPGGGTEDVTVTFNTMSYEDITKKAQIIVEGGHPTYSTGPNAVLATMTVNTIAVPPNPATYLAPVDGTIDVPVSDNLTWESVNYADGYKVYWDTETPPMAMISDQATTEYSFSGEYGTIYYWQVVPYNEIGDAENNPIWSYTTVDFVDNITPIDATDGMPLDTQLEWVTDQAPDAHRVFFGTDPLALATYEGVASPWSPTLNYSTTYYWQVEAEFGGDTYQSELWSFTVMDDPHVYNFPWTENFDDDTPPTLPYGWSVENTNGDGVEWQTNSQGSASEPNSMRIGYNSTEVMDDWVFSPPLVLTGGTQYQVSFWYIAGNGFTEKLEVNWGTDATSTAMTGGQIFNDSNITESLNHLEGRGVFTPSTDGVYYVGWHGYSEANQFWVAFDDVTVEYIPDITVNPTSIIATIWQDQMATEVIQISNDGQADLTVSDVASDKTWMTAAFASRTTVITPGQTANLNVEIDATGMVIGDSTAILTITSDDYDESVVNIPVALTVIQPPNINLNPTAITETLGQEEELIVPITISNTGDDTLKISSITDNAGSRSSKIAQSKSRSISRQGEDWLTLDLTQINILPGQNATVNATLNSTGLTSGQHTATITINSNDPDETQADIAVEIQVQLPDISLNPTELQQAMWTTDAPISQTFNIANDGLDTLNVSAITEGETWLTIANVAPVEIIPGGNMDVEVTFNATGLQEGVIYNSQIAVENNDPDEAPAYVDVTLIVKGPPEIDVTPMTIDQEMWVDQAPMDVITTINNMGGDTLKITSISCIAPWLIPDLDAVNILPTESADVTLTIDVTGMTTGNYSTQVTITSNDPDEPTTIVNVNLELNVEPDISISPMTLTPMVGLDEVVVEIIQINNTGGDTLEISSILDQLPSREVSWLTLNPIDGNILPGQMLEVTATFDATDLATGFYDADIFIASNDPDESPVTINATMQVVEPDIDLDITEISEILELEKVKMDTVKISNTGLDTLHINSISYGGSRSAWLGINLTQGQVNPGETLDLVITLTSGNMERGIYTDQIIITSNDPDEATRTVDVNLQVIAPEISITPLALTEVLEQNKTKIDTIKIANLGDDTLFVTSITDNATGSRAEFAISKSANQSKERGSRYDWLLESLTYTSILPGEEVNLLMTFRSGNMSAGTYQADILIDSNDQDESTVTVGATLEVITPDITVDPTNISKEFLPGQTGLETIETVEITNDGLDTLFITDISSNVAWLTPSGIPNLVMPGETELFNLTFDTNLPSDVYNGEVTITSNDPDEMTVTIDIMMDILVIPEFTELGLEISIDQLGWDELEGDLMSGFFTYLDPTVDYHYLNLTDMTAANTPLEEGFHGFYVNTYPEGFFDYWANRGVVAGATGWQGHMWEIINGNQPIFYIHVDAMQNYTLIDGLSKDYSGDDAPYLRINGDYPIGDYTYTGNVTGANGAPSEEIEVGITFDVQIPVFTNLGFEQSVDELSWDVVDTILGGRYLAILNAAETYSYIKLANGTGSNIPLMEEYFAFYITAHPDDGEFFAYWATKGVISGATDAEGHMWEIINGNQPIFYIHSNMNNELALIDGLQKDYYGVDTHFQVNGDCILGEYTYQGQITGENSITSNQIFKFKYSDGEVEEIDLMGDGPVDFDFDNGVGSGGSTVTIDPPNDGEDDNGNIIITQYTEPPATLFSPETALELWYNIDGGNYTGGYPVAVTFSWDTPIPADDELPILVVSLDGENWKDIDEWFDEFGNPYVTDLVWNLTTAPYWVSFNTSHFSDWVIGNGQTDPVPETPGFVNWENTKDWQRTIIADPYAETNVEFYRKEVLGGTLKNLTFTWDPFTTLGTAEVLPGVDITPEGPVDLGPNDSLSVDITIPATGAIDQLTTYHSTITMTGLCLDSANNDSTYTENMDVMVTVAPDDWEVSQEHQIADFSRDGFVTSLDVIYFAHHYYANPGEENWNPRFDIGNTLYGQPDIAPDNHVSFADLSWLSYYYGQGLNSPITSQNNTEGDTAVRGQFDEDSTQSLKFANGDMIAHNILSVDIVAQLQSLRGTEFEINFDAQKLELLSVTKGELPSSEAFFHHSVDAETGTITITFADMGLNADISGQGIVANLEFKIYDDTEISFGTIKAIDTEMNFVQLDKGQVYAISAEGNGHPATPTYYGLTQNYPNPFNPTTTIDYALPKEGRVQLSIYDVSGKLVKTLAEENQVAGYYSVTWDGTDNAGNDVGSGVYFYQITAGDYQQTKKCLLVK